MQAGVARPAAGQSMRLPPLGHLLPRYPGAVLFVAVLNEALAPRLPPDFLARLEGKPIAIELTDVAFRFDFCVRRARFVPLGAGGQGAGPVLKIAATAHDFATIAAGTEDSDTLFFQRRLVLDGDVELATEVKHTLDAIEFVRVRALLRRLLELLPR